MEQKEMENQILRRLLEFEHNDPGSYWPVKAILHELKISDQDSREVALNLHRDGFVELHEHAKDCVRITEKGKSRLIS
jgi:Mn-dependent DtxR family transcriptional regulator